MAESAGRVPAARWTHGAEPMRTGRSTHTFYQDDRRSVPEFPGGGPGDGVQPFARGFAQGQKGRSAFARRWWATTSGSSGRTDEYAITDVLTGWRRFH